MRFFFDSVEYNQYLSTFQELSKKDKDLVGESRVSALAYDFDKITQQLKNSHSVPSSADAVAKSSDGKRYVFIEFKSKKVDNDNIKAKLIDSVYVLSQLEHKEYFEYKDLEFICVYIPKRYKLEARNEAHRQFTEKQTQLHKFEFCRNEPYSLLFKNVLLLTYDEFDSKYTQYIQDIAEGDYYANI